MRQEFGPNANMKIIRLDYLNGGDVPGRPIWIDEDTRECQVEQTAGGETKTVELKFECEIRAVRRGR